MSPNRRSGSGSSQSDQSRTPARRQRPPYRDDKALARAGTGGSSGGSSLLIAGTLAAFVIGLVVIGLAYVTTRPGESPSGGTDVHKPSVLTPTDIPTDRTALGSSAATVTIDVYGDFRCSACFKFSVSLGTEPRLVENYVRTGKARIVWHDFVIIDKADGTTASLDAANAAQCAADQGKFWPMHDWLYGNQIGESASAFTKARLLTIGEAAGLSTDSFRTCVNGGTHNAEIAAATSAAPKEVDGTPSVFVNGKMIDPGYVPTYDSIAAAVEAALK